MMFVRVQYLVESFRWIPQGAVVLARFLIAAFFVTTLVSFALFTQMKEGGELQE